MSNYLQKNNETILRCANWAMELLYEELKSAISNSQFQNHEKINNFIEKLDQDIYGRGCINIEILDYFDSSKAAEKIPIAILYQLIGTVIDSIKQKKQFHADFIQMLEEFRARLN